jgi:hypothetical protein
MQRSLPVTLGLGTLLLACASAQEPHFTFAASNYHVSADQASIVQSPSFQEGVIACRTSMKGRGKKLTSS